MAVHMLDGLTAGPFSPEALGSRESVLERLARLRQGQPAKAQVHEAVGTLTRDGQQRNIAGGRARKKKCQTPGRKRRSPEGTPSLITATARISFHVHDEDSDHDHDRDLEDDEAPIEDSPLWRQDNVSLTTVGIDIGSSGTQVIFSRVQLRRFAEDLTSRYYVVKRETLFQSPVTLTPYQNEERIDAERLGAVIDDAYGAAGIRPDQIDTGVVILTGEALRRENAQRIAAVLSEQGGEFVTATAGHHMEAMLAAYGSGAARVSSDEISASSTSILAAAPRSSVWSTTAR